MAGVRLSFIKQMIKKLVIICGLLLILRQVFIYNESNIDETNSVPRSFKQPLVSGEIQSVREERASTDSCSAQTNFVYVKTHKTGSTTVSSVLRNFVLRNKLRSAFEKVTQAFMISYPGRIQPRYMDISTTYIKRKNTNSFLMHHFRYNPTMKNVMPNNTKYFTILREPWSHFKSSFHYFYHKNNIAKKTLDSNCHTYPYFHICEGDNISLLDYLKLAAVRLNENVPWFFRSKNGQSYDLGIDPTLNNALLIKNKIQSLSQELDLVMITEYMEESLILLKELLCMSWEDIIYTYKNQANPDTYIMKEELLPKEDYFTFYSMNKIDIMLYDHFNKTFRLKVEKYGRLRMENDVTHLKELMNEQGETVIDSSETLAADSTHEMTKNITFTKPLYYSSLKNLSLNKMKSILLKKLNREIQFIDSISPQQIDDLANYMLENSGGCPI